MLVRRVLWDRCRITQTLNRGWGADLPEKGNGKGWLDHFDGAYSQYNKNNSVVLPETLLFPVAECPNTICGFFNCSVGGAVGCCSGSESSFAFVDFKVIDSAADEDFCVVCNEVGSATDVVVGMVDTLASTAEGACGWVNVSSLLLDDFVSDCWSCSMKNCCRSASNCWRCCSNWKAIKIILNGLR